MDPGAPPDQVRGRLCRDDGNSLDPMPAAAALMIGPDCRISWHIAARCGSWHRSFPHLPI